MRKEKTQHWHIIFPLIPPSSSIRSNALAVSVRSFRVGGVSLSSQVTTNHEKPTTGHQKKGKKSKGQRNGSKGSGKNGNDDGTPVVTIQTALQLAVEQHNTGNNLAAEQIYRQIVEQHPQHSDALHLLGLVLYQKGDAASAIAYIERAIHTNGTFAAFHNTMGECLRSVGRLADAIKHYNRALTIA